jgi:hypothetical protein
VGLVAGLLVPASALAQAPAPAVVGVYRGFSQSEIDPRLRPMMELRVERQAGEDFFGTLLMGAPGGLLPFAFRGKVEAGGAFKGRGTGVAGDVRFTGILQDLRDGGALAHAGYRFTFPDGATDRGGTTLLRAFQPSDPFAPPDITGRWTGAETSVLDGRETGLDLLVTSQNGTSFEGVQTAGDIVPCAIVGTVGLGGHVVWIGVGDPGTVLVGGGLSGPVPNDGLQGTYSRAFVTGAVDLGAHARAAVVPGAVPAREGRRD